MNQQSEDIILDSMDTLSIDLSDTDLSYDNITANANMWGSVPVPTYTINTAYPTTNPHVHVGASGGSGTFTTNSTANNYYTYGSNGSIGSIGSINFNNNSGLQVKGDAEFDGNVKIKGRDLSKLLEKIEDRLAILAEPDPKKLEKFAALKKAYDHYKLMEKLIGDDFNDDSSK